jgi:hypothetical protein
VYFGYVISGVLKIDSTKIEAILKWIAPTNVTKVRSFVGETQYLVLFIVASRGIPTRGQGVKYVGIFVGTIDPFF